MQNGTAERWVPLAEAARELQVSVDTLRRRLRKGELVGEQRPTPQGFVWWVCIDDAAYLGSAPGPHAAHLGTSPTQHAYAPAPGVVELVQLVSKLQADVVAKAEAAAMWQARAEVLASQLEQAQRALEAPKEPDPSPGFTGSPPANGTVEVAQEPPKRKRWRWWPW